MKKIIISTIALLVIGGAITFGLSNPKADEDKVLTEKSVSAESINNISSERKPAELITREEAIKIAEAEVDGKAYSFEKDEDDGRIEYEIELKTDRGEAEVEMDAASGKILEVDYDDLDDDEYEDDHDD